MTQPQKVFGFLNVLGSWDPSLMFVMVGAIAVHFTALIFIRRRPRPVLASEWIPLAKKEITPALLIGAFIFGIGWGLGGYCPGPALTSLASLTLRPLVFVLSMGAGMIFFSVLDRRYRFRR